MQQAILQAFARHGQAAVNKAGSEACCESGWGPQAQNGQYLGLFQTGSYHYETIKFWSRQRFGIYAQGAYAFAWFDPWVNAHTAQSSYVDRGNFSAFTCEAG